MGLPGCDCRVDFDVEGEFNLGLVRITFDVDIDICPNCGPANSTVSANVTATSIIPALNFSLSFDGTLSGLPICEDGVLEAVVGGTFTIGGVVFPNQFITLTLNGNTEEICVLLPEEIEEELPDIVPNPLCLPAEGLTVIDCP